MKDESEGGFPQSVLLYNDSLSFYALFRLQNNFNQILYNFAIVPLKSYVFFFQRKSPEWHKFPIISGAL